ncbi:alpha-L-glutamate ligase-like protein [Dasania sp. GY-MA-18]|uniref:Alpha-L-glutamate ligase-like protein n=1 Tax=Dasania phycosphaerae TaxID=2950436 RepID=A0A9J6RJ03_9GAMM|nr:MULTISPECIES: alpha-L-glutamate ligase-like protein [Dasania]MCR8922015.1 alpha-L-glutamate ligase-like protein [Dasania sp. GY-MA-18]MCZ0864443.1 alpha-L-glutamate ligase-like protein [Dasania phycosphaerae]MCZ0868171.1 alpha-L-glutamate ligase-like protein [Dasania phycosphaerae]
MLFVWPKELKQLGLLGMNSRNINYIARHNPRHLYPIVDNKLLTKKAAIDAGIRVPELLGVIESNHELSKLPQLLAPLTQFVIKPTRGSGGKGILVISGREFDFFLKTNGSKILQSDIRRHVNNILSGLYSLGGKPDKAMIEAMIQYDDIFNEYTYEGVPDLRVIVYKGFPIMAMLRCATHSSDGRANLHQGAIGVGIDILTGKSQYAVQHGRPVTEHPDTGKSFKDLSIPYWQEILRLTAGCHEMTGLGYIGCDIVIDKEQGPMILELNARPGLAIQLACGLGLEKRLSFIDRLSTEVMEQDADKRVSFLMSNQFQE